MICAPAIAGKDRKFFFTEFLYFKFTTTFTCKNNDILLFTNLKNSFMANGKIIRHLPPPPAAAEAGFIEEFIGGVAQGPPYFVYHIPVGLKDPAISPALEEMVVYTKGNGRTAFDVEKAL